MAGPVVAIPFLTGKDQLGKCIASILLAGAHPLVIDNGGTLEDWQVPGLFTMPSNLGVAASWNLAIRTAPSAPYWLFANHDTVCGAGDIARLVAEMERGGPRWVGVNGDWRLMGLTRETVRAVGFFDENFHPIYCEDADYERRCDLAGVPRYFISGGSTHVGSATIRDPRYGEMNARTYPANRAYYRAKWGGELRGGETFTSPFNRGGPVSEWSLDIDRLRDNAWEG